jgi:hypothetical protein
LPRLALGVFSGAAGSAIAFSDFAFGVSNFGSKLLT